MPLFTAKLGNIHDLLFLDMPGVYQVNVGDLVKIPVAFPMYPAALAITDLEVVLSDPDLAWLVGIFRQTPDSLKGSGTIASFFLMKKNGNVRIKVTPLDINGNKLLDRLMIVDLVIK